MRMRAVVQRVLQASVTVDDETTGAIGAGLLVYLGVGHRSVELHLDERIFLAGFDLIGIRRNAGMHVAVVSPHKSNRIHELRQEDKFGSHRVVEISAERLTLQSDETLEKKMIAVGGRFAPESL